MGTYADSLLSEGENVIRRERQHWLALLLDSRSAIALIRFDGGKTLELSTSWAINQPPQQQGTLCRLYGDKAAVDVYSPHGAQLYRNLDEKGDAKATPLKPPMIIGHTALIRHFKDCIHGRATPAVGPAEGVALMQMIEAIYKSDQSGKSEQMKA